MKINEAKYSDSQPRDEHGRWEATGDTPATGGGGGAGAGAGFAQTIHDQGGFTYSAAGGYAHTGVMLSPYPGREMQIPADQVTEQSVQDFQTKNADVLSQPNHYIGAWMNTDNNTVYLDVSVALPPGADVQAALVANNQIAAYDLGSGTEIRQTGKSRVGKHSIQLFLPPTPGVLGDGEITDLVARIRAAAEAEKKYRAAMGMVKITPAKSAKLVPSGYKPRPRVGVTKARTKVQSQVRAVFARVANRSASLGTPTSGLLTSMYQMTDADQAALEQIISEGRQAAWLASYKLVMQRLKRGKPADYSVPPQVASAQMYLARTAVFQIAQTYISDLYSFASQPITPTGKQADQWMKARADWKSAQVANYETGHASSAGTRSAINDVVGHKDAAVADPMVVAFLPDESSSDICEEFAGTYVDFENAGDLPDPPLHNGCIHYLDIVPASDMVGEELPLTSLSDITDVPEDSINYIPGINDSEVKQATADAVDKALAAEPGITNALEQEIAASNGRLEGLDFRLKSADSLQRKIATEANSMGLSPAEASTLITDSVRYTDIIPASSYARDTQAMIDTLKADGYKVEKFKDTWGQPGYQGLNMVFESPSGQVFELQFHTQVSFDTKENLGHPLYEKLRRAVPGSKEANDLQDQVNKVFSAVPTPDGAESIHKFRRRKIANVNTTYYVFENLAGTALSLLRMKTDANDHVIALDAVSGTDGVWHNAWNLLELVYTDSGIVSVTGTRLTQLQRQFGVKKGKARHANKGSTRPHNRA